MTRNNFAAYIEHYQHSEYRRNIESYSHGNIASTRHRMLILGCRHTR